jgi:hypothetical protein
MPDRITFLITCGGVVVTPALAQFTLPSAGVCLPAPLPSAPLKFKLKVEGWEPRTDGGSEVWVQINSSWRATWR